MRLQKVANYFRGSYLELKKVVWPTKKETFNYTMLVIAISIAFAIYIGVFDFLFTFVFEQVVKLK